METDQSNQKICDPDNLHSTREDCKHHFFGIKSYLHNFYENVSPKNDYDDCDDEYTIQSLKDKQKRSIVWTVALIGGFTSMICGSIMLLVGFTFSKMKIDIGYQEEMRIIDKSAYEFNEHLDQIKIIGLMFFAMGGILVASALLLPSLMPNNDDETVDESTHFKLRIDDDCVADMQIKNLIPVTEELKIVQPKQENTTIITNAGLKQIDLE